MKSIRSVLVVGGGTAGWLSAAYLHRALGPNVTVTLVESPNIGRIGVGEATVSTLRATMAFLGFDESQWMPHVGATYKTAVRFEQWNRSASEGREHFYHPFFEHRQEPMLHPLPTYLLEVGDGVSLMHYWHKRRLEGDATPYAYAVFPGPAICDARKAPRFAGSDQWAVPTAYHLDAHKFAAFMAAKIVERGVRHVRDDVTGVKLDSRGFIAGVATREHGELTADLYVDCTGFRSVLLGQTLKEPFDSAAKWLWNDSAVAMRPKNAPGDLEPYTLARASDAGWMWNIPLYHRAGTGYVYSSRYASSDGAERELRGYLGERATEETPALHLKFTPGRYRRAWVGNCVAIGLAASFIEPLESTTIFLIEYALGNLLTLLPDRDFDPARAKRYNRIVAQMFDEVRDFIALHFALANRRDTPYWRDLAEASALPDSLAEHLEFFRASLPLGERFRNFVFRERSYCCLLSGLGRLPTSPYPLLAHVGGEEQADRAFAEMAARSSDLAARLPGHREYLERAYREAGVDFVG